MLSLALLYGDELSVLTDERRAHSVAVGEKAALAAAGIEAQVRAHLVAAATLHDVGYGHVDTGLHALDGARHLRHQGYPAAVVELVAMHSASWLEAEVRGLDPSLLRAFTTGMDLGAAHAVLWWADMTTGPQGEDVEVEERLHEICARYGPADLVTLFIERARPMLLAAGQSPTGSIQVLS
jgi:hypothetical protein